MTFEELGVNNLLIREVDIGSTSLDVNGNSIVSQITSSSSDSSEVASSDIVSGEMTGNLFINKGFLRSKGFETGVSGWSLNDDGTIEAESGYFRGDITGATGTFSGTVSVGSLNIPDSTTASSFHTDTSGNSWWGTNVATGYATAPARILANGSLVATSATITGALTTGAGSSITTSYLSGLVGLANENIAAQGWTNTCVFSATNYRVVAWATGVITSASGTAYNITAGNTGNMAATTYIYLDIAVSTTVLQTTTTAGTANGSGKIHVATAAPNTDTTSKAQYQAFGGVGGVRVFVDNISANSASTNEFISNSAQLANLVVTNAKINDLTVSKLTAGSITSKTVTLAVTDGAGDCYFNAGKTDFTNADSGFILGIDDSDSNRAKFYIGNANNYLNWTGTQFVLKGAVTYSAGSIQFANANTERTVNYTYGVNNDDSNFTNSQKKKEITLNNGGTITVSFEHKSVYGSGSRNTYAAVYINGVIAGTPRNTGIAYVAYTEDFAVSAGDKVQLYTHGCQGTGYTSNSYVKNFMLMTGAVDGSVIDID